MLVEAQPEARHSAKIIAALPKAAKAYKQQIERGLDSNLWAEFYARPAALVKKAVGTGVGSGGSGGVICTVPTIPTRIRLR